jgi:hypothetical protein
MVELHQLLCVVTIVETLCNGIGLQGGFVVSDLEVGSSSVVDDAHPLEAMSRVAPPLEDDFAIESYFASGSMEEYLASGIAEDRYR